MYFYLTLFSIFSILDFLFFPTMFVILFSLLYSLVGTLHYFHFLVCALVSFVLIEQYHFWFPLLTRSLSCTFFSLNCFGFAFVYVYGCVFMLLGFVPICLILCSICPGFAFVSCFVLYFCMFVLIPF